MAAHATQRLGDLTGKNVVVSGAGTIGNFIAQACKCRGAKNVLITDISDFRLDKARQVGITRTCNVSQVPLSNAVEREFGSEGFDAGIEVAGVEASLASLIANVTKGGTILIVGVYGEHPTVDMSVVCEHELEVKGSMMYRKDDWDQAVQWIASGGIVTEPLVSGHFSFGEFPDAYKFIDEQGEKSMKLMIDF